MTSARPSARVPSPPDRRCVCAAVRRFSSVDELSATARNSIGRGDALGDATSLLVEAMAAMERAKKAMEAAMLDAGRRSSTAGRDSSTFELQGRLSRNGPNGSCGGGGGIGVGGAGGGGGSAAGDGAATHGNRTKVGGVPSWQDDQVADNHVQEA